jgi:hypothetical protein
MRGAPSPFPRAPTERCAPQIALARLELPIGTELKVALNAVLGRGSMVFQTYLGLQFSDPGGMPAGSFLERYLLLNFDA